ncbi:hypothetical protein [Methanogenium cariaci]|nr:hypothetical protein [Methanogenium cariaci]
MNRYAFVTTIPPTRTGGPFSVVLPSSPSITAISTGSTLTAVSTPPHRLL